MDIFKILTRAAALFPDRLAVIDGPLRPTYREVAGRVAALAGQLRRLGLKAGDRLSTLERNSLPHLEAYYAAAGLGAILNPLNTRLAAPEIAQILGDAGSRWLLSDHALAPRVRETLAAGAELEGVIWIRGGPLGLSGLAERGYDELVQEEQAGFAPARVAGDDVAHLYYTSGTTGRPKGVMLTHRNVCVHALGAIAELGLTDRDVWGHVAPMFHLADAWATFALTWVGGGHVMVGRFAPERVLEAIVRHRITLSNLVPTMLNLLVKHPGAASHDLSSLRLILSGGAPIAPELVGRIVDLFGCEYVQTYGMTETSPYLTLSVLKEHQRELPAAEQLRYRAMTGRPFITVELKVVDDEGREVAPDGRQVGEIRVRGETVTPGYWKKPDETRAAFVDGWLCTGDLAVRDREGFVNIVDRKKDVILTGGENVYSTEVENVLYEHPAVLEAAAFGVADENWGEVVCAAIVLLEGRQATVSEIQAFCRKRLAGYKVPRRVEFLSGLPKTGSGKIQKSALRERLAANSGS